ncbi:hypothetical protein [Flavobacterium sp. ACAM 123]|uniref:hypothetical protein n=1 Tax=Flavobacterium sp. ACAM 123 TaxID=1189620 RepID=UPI0002EA542D|nr:hypothetical protein [Flavobacterium sp. ACAM 123]
MSEYENRVLKMLTSSEEKFKSAFEITNHFNKVKKQLVIKFWKNVEEELNKLITDSDETFKVKLDSDVFHSNSKCFLYLDNKTEARFLYEHLSTNQCMGLWYENQKFNTQKIDSFRNEFQNEITYYTKQTWWISFKNLDENFSNFESLLMILPENAEVYSKSKAQDLFDFAVENKTHLQYIINNCLK